MNVMLTRLYMLEDDAMFNVVTVFQSLQMHDGMLYTPSVPNYTSFWIYSKCPIIWKGGNTFTHPQC
jgi:hypothetical protein